jgi:hypothetical protein
LLFAARKELTTFRVSTMRKQSYSVLDGLTSVFAGQPIMPRLG